MAPSITDIARIASIPPWMRSEPWAGIFNNPSICFCGLWSGVGTVFELCWQMLLSNLICFLYYLSNLVCNNLIFILWWWICIYELYVICDIMLNHVQSWLFVDRLSRPVVVLDRLPGLYGLKYDNATACGLPLYLCSYKFVGSATK